MKDKYGTIQMKGGTKLPLGIVLVKNNRHANPNRGGYFYPFYQILSCEQEHIISYCIMSIFCYNNG